jgi:hypothetical protein
MFTDVHMSDTAVRTGDLPACSIVPQPTTLPRGTPICNNDVTNILDSELRSGICANYIVVTLSFLPLND